MWIETQAILKISDAQRLAYSVLSPGEPLWHLAMGDPARDPPKAPTWREVRSAAKDLTQKALATARGVKAADVVGGAVVIGGMMVADSALRAIGIPDGLPDLGGDVPPPQESLDGYLLILTPARLALAEVGSVMVERPLSLPKHFSRVRALAQWSPASLAHEGPRFARETSGRNDRWRVTLGAQSFDFGAHGGAFDNLTQAEAIAARVASLRPPAG